MTNNQARKIEQIIKLINFTGTLDDIEIIKSVLENIGENLTEMLGADNSSTTDE